MLANSNKQLLAVCSIRTALAESQVQRLQRTQASTEAVHTHAHKADSLQSQARSWELHICRHVVGVCILCACMCITTCMGVVFCCCFSSSSSFFFFFFGGGGGGGPNVHKLKETMQRSQLAWKSTKFANVSNCRRYCWHWSVDVSFNSTVLLQIWAPQDAAMLVHSSPVKNRHGWLMM